MYNLFTGSETSFSKLINDGLDILSDRSFRDTNGVLANNKNTLSTLCSILFDDKVRLERFYIRDNYILIVPQIM